LTVATPVWDNLIGFTKGLIGAIKDAFEWFWNQLKEFAESLVRIVKDAVEWAWNTFYEAPPDPLKKIYGTIEGIFTKIVNTFFPTLFTPLATPIGETTKIAMTGLGQFGEVEKAIPEYLKILPTGLKGVGIFCSSFILGHLVVRRISFLNKAINTFLREIRTRLEASGEPLGIGARVMYMGSPSGLQDL